MVKQSFRAIKCEIRIMVRGLGGEAANYLRNLPDVGHVVELGNHRMQQLGSGETALSLDLRAEMSENDDGRHIGPNED
jgi:hypothetical protein